MNGRKRDCGGKLAALGKFCKWGTGTAGAEGGGATTEDTKPAASLGGKKLSPGHTEFWRQWCSGGDTTHNMFICAT